MSDDLNAISTTIIKGKRDDIEKLTRGMLWKKGSVPRTSSTRA